MKNKKVIILCLVMMLIFALCGCQSVRPDGLGGISDRKIGVYVVPTLANKEENSAEEMMGFDERLYAVLKPRTFTNPDTGELSEIWSYVFEGVAGVSLFLPKVMEPDDENYIDISYDFNGASETHMTHGKESVSIEGTLYFVPNSVDVIHGYPVYQSQDGQVYLVRIAGWGINDEVSEGIGFSQTYKDEDMLTINENQISRSQAEEKVEVTVNIGMKYLLQKVNFIQMNAEHVQISHEEYEVQALPEEVSIGPNTAYLVVESYVDTPDGEVVRREIFDREDEQFIGYTSVV